MDEIRTTKLLIGNKLLELVDGEGRELIDGLSSRVSNLLDEYGVNTGTVRTVTTLFESSTPSFGNVSTDSGYIDLEDALADYDEIEIKYNAFGKTGIVKAHPADFAESTIGSTAFHWSEIQPNIAISTDPERTVFRHMDFYASDISDSTHDRLNVDAVVWGWNGDPSSAGKLNSTFTKSWNSEAGQWTASGFIGGIISITGIKYTESGSTKDPELVDIRTGADGTVYNTAGDAVRGQVTALEGQIGTTGNNLAAAYDATQTYAVGDYCVKDGVLYKCTTAIATAEAWTAGHWTAVKVMSEMNAAVNDLKEDLSILSNDTIGEVKTPIDLTANTRTATSNEAGLDFTQGAKSGYQTAIIDCQAGDVFDIYTNTQSTSYNSWAFYRLNDAETGHVRTTWGTGSDSVARITAGIRDVKLVVNNNSTYIASPKVEKVAVNSTSLKSRVDSVEAIVAKNLNHIAFLRRGLFYSTTTKTITISAQQMLYDGKRASFSESKTIDISGVANYFAVVFDKDTQAFSAVTSDFTLTDSQYLVGAFDARVPEKGFVFGDYTLNGFIRQNGVNPISTLGFENVASDWWIYPTAVRYAGVRDKTYAGFINNTGVCGVIAYNNVTGHIERRNMYISNEVDEHNAPSVSVLSSGKVMVIFTRHAKTPYHVICISKGKESISEFDRYSIKTDHDAVTYSQVVDMGGVLYLFYRAHDYAEGTTSTAKYYWAYRTSTDGGVTWSDEVTWLTGDTVQYYMLARKYDDTHIKIFMQSNATLSETDIRLAFFDTENGKILDADMSTEIADLSALSEPVSYTAFTIILAKTRTYKNRILSVAEGTTLSFVCGRIASANNYAVYLYKYVNGSWTANTIPNVGASFGGGTNSTYINHAEVVDADNGTYTVVYAAQTESGWELRKVSVASTAGTPSVLASSNNKIIRPFKIVGDNSVIFTLGTWTDYTDYNQDFVIKSYV